MRQLWYQGLFIPQVLQMVHDELGHNGTQEHTYYLKDCIIGQD